MEKWAKNFCSWRVVWGDEFKKCLPRLRAWLDEYGKTLISPKKEWFLSKQKTICYGI
jgi:hypothetical protein